MWTTKDVIGLRSRWGTALLVVSTACTGVSSLPPSGGGTTGTPGQPGSQDNPGTATGGSTGTGTGTTAGNSSAVSGTTMQSTQFGSIPPGPLDSGRVAMRRLNNHEYDATVRDLLGTATTPAASTFPPDGVDEYDTVGDALSYSDKLFAEQFAATTALVNELEARPTTDPLRTAVLVCTPTASTLSTCLNQILTGFMPKAWRRPVTTAEVTTAVTVGTAASTAAGATDAGATDPVTAGLSAALQYVLLSPNFLYHVELGNPVYNPTSSAVTTLSDYEVASRLSYFLWSSMPDAQLTTAAAMGTLANAKGIPAQVTRMIADPKFSGFINNFVGQWLGVQNVADVSPDPTMFPNVDQPLIDAIAPETNTFVQALITNDAPLTELLTANYTYANGRLAQFYGLSGIPATQTTFTKASLAGTQRLGGILTQETFLTTTSFPTRTSPVHRGAYVLSWLVCSPPAPPPPVVPALVVPDAGTGLTVRDALNLHATSPACAGCHNVIDPIGFTFENFDATGAYRTTDNSVTIDASGSLDGINGPQVTGAQGMAAAIVADPRFVPCVVKQAMTYGIGRKFDLTDGVSYVETVAQPLNSGGTWQSALQAVATSQAFLTIRGGQ